MDRFDEKKHDRTHEGGEARHDEVTPAREGDVLGLGGSAVPKAPDDPRAAQDPDAAARRRARMREGEAEESARRERGTEDNFGSTSIDMGAGGKGNTIKRP